MGNINERIRVYASSPECPYSEAELLAQYNKCLETVTSVRSDLNDPVALGEIAFQELGVELARMMGSSSRKAPWIIVKIGDSGIYDSYRTARETIRQAYMENPSKAVADGLVTDGELAYCDNEKCNRYRRVLLYTKSKGGETFQIARVLASENNGVCGKCGVALTTAPEGIPIDRTENSPNRGVMMDQKNDTRSITVFATPRSGFNGSNYDAFKEYTAYLRDASIDAEIPSMTPVLVPATVKRSDETMLNLANRFIPQAISLNGFDVRRLFVGRMIEGSRIASYYDSLSPDKLTKKSAYTLGPIVTEGMVVDFIESPREDGSIGKGFRLKDVNSPDNPEISVWYGDELEPEINFRTGSRIGVIGPLGRAKRKFDPNNPNADERGYVDEPGNFKVSLRGLYRVPNLWHPVYDVSKVRLLQEPSQSAKAESASVKLTVDEAAGTATAIPKATCGEAVLTLIKTAVDPNGIKFVRLMEAATSLGFGEDEVEIAVEAHISSGVVFEPRIGWFKYKEPAGQERKTQAVESKPVPPSTPSPVAPAAPAARPAAKPAETPVDRAAEIAKAKKAIDEEPW